MGAAERGLCYANPKRFWLQNVHCPGLSGWGRVSGSQRSRAGALILSTKKRCQRSAAEERGDSAVPAHPHRGVPVSRGESPRASSTPRPDSAAPRPCTVHTTWPVPGRPRISFTLPEYQPRAAPDQRSALLAGNTPRVRRPSGEFRQSGVAASRQAPLATAPTLRTRTGLPPRPPLAYVRACARSRSPGLSLVAGRESRHAPTVVHGFCSYVQDAPTPPLHQVVLHCLMHLLTLQSGSFTTANAHQSQLITTPARGPTGRISLSVQAWKALHHL